MPSCEILKPEQILAIPVAAPERLFSAPAAARAEYLRLARRWHPDRSGDGAVFQHVNALWAEARRRIEAGSWNAPEHLELSAVDGRRFRFRHRRRHRFELGEMLIGHGSLGFLIDQRYAPLAANAERVLGGLRFADAHMQAELAPALPAVRTTLETADARVMVVDKPGDLILLDDVLAHMGGRLDPRSAAWVLSCLYNLACYLEWAGLTHNAIGPASVFLSPRRHACALLGGWWYAAAEGAPLASLPRRSFDVLPPDAAAARAATARLDLELVRLTGRELLGSACGAGLRGDPAVPEALADWLVHPTSGSAIADYEDWQTVLDRSFGPRRFAPMNLCADDVYNP